ncbi:hypothetical protein CHS0354_015227 [Potamilus streckersoni]|uniref:Uncharacterized protein n=1 Tax=Potamilus streckersoni TaxID=2493646 RepID=A0AAE0RRI1_9BIVA|nr:hypothetical protein CHS0354_015227 [Potamilus streckersoni]
MRLFRRYVVTQDFSSVAVIQLWRSSSPATYQVIPLLLFPLTVRQMATVTNKYIYLAASDTKRHLSDRIAAPYSKTGVFEQEMASVEEIHSGVPVMTMHEKCDMHLQKIN